MTVTITYRHSTPLINPQALVYEVIVRIPVVDKVEHPALAARLEPGGRKTQRRFGTTCKPYALMLMPDDEFDALLEEEPLLEDDSIC